jgi:hypothetical protein
LILPFSYFLQTLGCPECFIIKFPELSIAPTSEPATVEKDLFWALFGPRAPAPGTGLRRFYFNYSRIHFYGSSLNRNSSRAKPLFMQLLE